MGRLKAVLLAHAGEASVALGLAIPLCALAALAVLLILRRRPVAMAPFLVLLTGLAVLAVHGRHRLADEVGGERLAVLTAMALRPGDPWPRSDGHIPLGAVGAAPDQKGYLEPGGGFSPRPGAFGVSIWSVPAAGGGPIAASDTVPLADTVQTYVGDGVPTVQATTPYYRAAWRTPDVARAELRLEPVGAGRDLELVLRGVGPGGGRLTEIARGPDGTWILNGRWTLRTRPVLQPAFLGVEGWGWRRSRAVGKLPLRDKNGWLAARLKVPPGSPLEVEILDARPGPPPPPAPGRAPLPATGADARFDASLAAQVATLRQSLIGREIAPGDPYAYPLPWLRDGAYVQVALARAGQTDRLAELAQPFAKRDFFGGFGSEADAPGLALWALGETSIALGDPAFDRTIWPDVRRKVGLIREMLGATSPVRKPYSGPVSPARRNRDDLDLVAEPAADGFIQGRMDWHRPVFYVNGVSVLGLRHAAAIARRLGHVEEAEAWARLADGLAQTWRRNFQSGARDAENERTAMSGLWPAEVADPQPFRNLLERRWASTRAPHRGGYGDRPRWTYFEFGEAHQWLRLRRPDRAWATLDWFWAHQPAPGLFTVWEGKGGGDNFGQWKATRGWVDPPYVTPHYWGAAELLLLQLAMLAEVEGEPGRQTLVIGSGVPAAWLRRPFSVKGVGTADGPVDWSWDGTTVTVSSLSNAPLALGPAFPPNTPIVRATRRRSSGPRGG